MCLVGVGCGGVVGGIGYHNEIIKSKASRARIVPIFTEFCMRISDILFWLGGSL